MKHTRSSLLAYVRTVECDTLRPRISEILFAAPLDVISLLMKSSTMPRMSGRCHNAGFLQFKNSW